MSDLLAALGRGMLHVIGAVFDLVLDLGHLAADSRRPRLWLGAVGGVVACPAGERAGCSGSC